MKQNNAYFFILNALKIKLNNKFAIKDIPCNNLSTSFKMSNGIRSFLRKKLESRYLCLVDTREGYYQLTVYSYYQSKLN